MRGRWIGLWAVALALVAVAPGRTAAGVQDLVRRLRARVAELTKPPSAAAQSTTGRVEERLVSPDDSGDRVT
jgi:hypothetical protein